MKTPHREKRRLPRRWSNSPSELSFMEYQYIEALVVVGKFGHSRMDCGTCEICLSIDRLLSRISRNRVRIVMLAAADRLGLGGRDWRI